MLLYPYEPFLRWMLSYGWDNHKVLNTLKAYQLFFEESLIFNQLDVLRDELVENGTSAMERRVRGNVPSTYDGRVKPLTKKDLKKAVGVSIDLGDPRNPAMLGSMEMISRVPSLRRILQLLLAKKVRPADIIGHLKRHYEMSLDVEAVRCFQQYFWPASLEYADLYLWMGRLPESDPDRNIISICLDQDLNFTFQQLGMLKSMKFEETEFYRLFLTGASQKILDSLNPMLNPKGFPPKDWVAVYEKIMMMQTEFNDRNKGAQAGDLLTLFRNPIRLKQEPPKKLKAMGEVKGEIV